MEEYQPGPEERDFFGEDVETLYRPVGCQRCSSSGYRGRLAIHEILVMDSKIRELLVRGEEEQIIKKQAVDAGMITLKEDGKQKAINRVTGFQEIVRIVG